MGKPKERGMSKRSMALGLFLLEHRSVLAGLIQTLGTQELAALLRSPFEQTTTLLEKHGLGALASRLSALVSGAETAEREELEAALRAELRDLEPAREAGARA